MKKLFSKLTRLACLLLTFVMSFSFIACAGTGNEGEEDTTTNNQASSENTYIDTEDYESTVPEGVEEFGTHDYTAPMIEDKWLVKDGATLYTLVVPATTVEADKTAFNNSKREFLKFFEQATGIVLDVKIDTSLPVQTHSADQHYISLGKTTLLTSLGDTVDYSKEENMVRFDAELSKQNNVFNLSIEDKLPEPARVGYIFLGWFDGEDKVEKISGNISLTAKWEIIKFEIQYDLNGGAWQEGLEGPTVFEYGQEVVISEPVKEGYTFLGWTQASEYVEKIGNEDYRLTAKWKANDQTGYEVIFDLNGGQFEKNLDQFAKEFVEEFSTVSGTKVDRVDFKGTTGSAIKSFFDKADILAKYNERGV